MIKVSKGVGLSIINFVAGESVNFFKIKSCHGVLLLFLLLAIMVGVSPSRAGEIESREEIDRLEKSNLPDRIKLEGLVEVEGGVYGKESDISLATVALGFDAQVSEYGSARVVFLYEDGEDFLVDEAAITITNRDKNSLYVTGGRMYVPFGNFTTSMVSDPLTHAIGETREDALLVGFEANRFYASVYTFNGDVGDGGAEKIEHYGTNFGYRFASETVSVDVGGGWISSIRDSDGITAVLGGGPVTVADYVGGHAAHLLVGFGRFSLVGEYVGADADINGSGTNSQISSYNVEAGVSWSIVGKNASFAVGFQATDEALWFGAPAERVIAAFGIEIMDSTNLALEWFNEEAYGVTSGTDRDVFTLQLGVKF